MNVNKKKMNKYIIITGNQEKIGKGVVSSSIGANLESMGFKIEILQIFSYMNQDITSIDQKYNGNSWITEYGEEVHSNMGDYYRILNKEQNEHSSISFGNLLQNIFRKERKNLYNGEIISMENYLKEELNIFLNQHSEEQDFFILEIGGNIGSLETNLVLKKIGEIFEENNGVFYHLNISLVPQTNAKTDINLFNLMLKQNPLTIDNILLRSEEILNKNFFNLPYKKSIYEIPIAIAESDLIRNILKKFHVSSKSQPDLEHFKKILNVLQNDKLETIRVGIIGKDSLEKKQYQTIIDALEHSGIYLNLRVSIDIFDPSLPSEHLKEFQAIILPHGKGKDMTEIIINHLRYTRQYHIPTLLIGLGSDLGLIEIARHILKISDSTSVEFSEKGTPIITFMDENKNLKLTNINNKNMIGYFPIYLESGSIAYKTYKLTNKIDKEGLIWEKFNHKLWINYNLRHLFEKTGVYFSFTDHHNKLLYGFELDQKLHKFYLGVKFYPEFGIKTPYHPLFVLLLEKSRKT